jgi:signal transduction histidine kinase
MTLLIFLASVVAVLGLLALLTARTLGLERDELRAKADAIRQEALRLALWRMDSTVAPIIAQEAARPYFHYLSYYPEQRAFTRVWEPVRPGEVLVPSPLVEGTPPFVLLHFQVNADGRLTSPQVPQGNDRDLAESEPGGAARVEHYEKLLGSLAALSLDPRDDRPESHAARAGAHGRNLSARDARRIARADAAPAPTETPADAAMGLEAASEASPRSAGLTAEESAEREYGYRKEAADLASRPAPVTGQAQQFAQQPEAAPPTGAAEQQAAPSLAESAKWDLGASTDLLKRESLEEPVLDATSRQLAVIGGDRGFADPTANESIHRIEPVPERVPASNLLGLASTRTRIPIPETPFLRRGPSRFVPTPVDRPDLSQSAFVPRWRKGTGDGPAQLLVWRSVRAETSTTLQGFWVDWPALERHLLSRIGDVLPGASIVPVPSVESLDPTLSSRLLASIPAMIVPPPAPAVTVPLWSPSHVTIGLTWLATLIAVGAVGLSLRASITLGERRGRFVSAVTHELRTPLTTFVLYSQMLADGMVPEGEPRREYLSTLKGEAVRLQRIVENVLEFARLGRARPSATTGEPVSVRSLTDHAVPALEQRAAQAGMTLEVVVDPHAEHASARASRDAVARVLTNLVDNACKYASESQDKAITLHVGVSSERVMFRVRDRGPGVPPSERRRIFRAFARGRRHESSPAQGLGLGLSPRARDRKAGGGGPSPGSLESGGRRSRCGCRGCHE